MSAAASSRKEAPERLALTQALVPVTAAKPRATESTPKVRPVVPK
jgi:hypothetical protein